MVRRLRPELVEPCWLPVEDSVMPCPSTLFGADTLTSPAARVLAADDSELSLSPAIVLCHKEALHQSYALSSRAAHTQWPADRRTQRQKLCFNLRTTLKAARAPCGISWSFSCNTSGGRFFLGPTMLFSLPRVCNFQDLCPGNLPETPNSRACFLGTQLNNHVSTWIEPVS